MTLYGEVTKVIKLKYEESKDEYWGANLVSNSFGVVYFKETNYPASCLTHELLHLSLQIRGYKRIRVGFSLFDQTPFFSQLLTALDNELQHHKMYKQFIQLGFQPKEFYIDSDATTEEYLIQALKEPISSIKEILLDFITLIAPGGSIPDKRKNGLIEQYKRVSDSIFFYQLDKIEKIFIDWAKSETLNSENTLRKIFLVLENPTYTWLGFGCPEEFPQNGFFVDKIFELKK